MPTGTLMTRSSPPAPVRFAARAALAARRAEMLGVAKVDQRVEAGDRLEDDVAALAAIAAVGAAIFDELLAPEADGAGAARAGADEDLGLIEEMHEALDSEAAANGYPWQAPLASIPLSHPLSGLKLRKWRRWRACCRSCAGNAPAKHRLRRIRATATRHLRAGCARRRDGDATVPHAEATMTRHVRDRGDAWIKEPSPEGDGTVFQTFSNIERLGGFRPVLRDSDARCVKPLASIYSGPSRQCSDRSGCSDDL